MAEHTEVPWELIVDDEDLYVTMPKYLGEDDCLIAVYSSATDPDVRLADAGFIVRAVNNHDALLAACEAALGVLSYWSEQANSDYFTDRHGMGPVTKKALKSVRAAISTATGGI